MEARDGRVAIEVLDRSKDRGSGSKQGSRFWIEARIEVPDDSLVLPTCLTASDR